MPRTVETQVYKFDELSEKAKERARDWFKEGDDFDPDMEDLVAIAEIFGIDLKQKPVKLMSGKTRYDPCIWWEGFGCQGNGASFEGTWRYPSSCYDKYISEKIREYAPGDVKLNSIGESLDALHSQYPQVEVVRITQSGRYSHEYSMDVAAFQEDGDESEAEVSDAFREPMRAFARYIYDTLEEEYIYRNSDEYVDDCIEMNNYEFDEDGRRVEA